MMPIPPILIETIGDASLAYISMDGILAMAFTAFAIGLIPSIGLVAAFRRQRGRPSTRAFRAVTTTLCLLVLPLEALPVCFCAYLVIGSEFYPAFILLALIICPPLIWLQVMQIKGLIRTWRHRKDQSPAPSAI